MVVDEFSKSSVDNIYAVGDVTHRVNLTPVAVHEATAFAETLFNDKPTPVDHTFIPTAVFSQPEIGTVGLTEEKAREMYRSVDIYKARFRPLKATVSGRDEKMLMKLVVDMDTRQSARVPYSRAGRGRDRADGGDRAQARRHQGAVRRHHGAASERGGGTGDHAAQMGSAGAGGGVRCGGLRTKSRW